MTWIIVQRGYEYQVCLRLACDGMSMKADHYIVIATYSSLTLAELEIERRKAEK